MYQYSNAFYDDLEAGSLRSASEIVPLIVDWLQPRSVIDFGCGTGAWLSVFKRYGIQKILGLDGDYVDRKRLLIPADCFQPCDLTVPEKHVNNFDLVISLEVAEHFSEEYADDFILQLTGLAPVVIFSAAIPFQGGENHVNEQWPEYWSMKFEALDFVAIDCIRHRIWDNANVEWWYAQNMMLYVSKGQLARYPRLKNARVTSSGSPRSLVHPRNYFQCQTSMKSFYSAAEEIADLIPLGKTFVSIDDGSLGSLGVVGRLAIPLGETLGNYSNLPRDDGAAILDIERKSASGLCYAVVYWTAFWWWEQHFTFREHVESTYLLVLKSDRVMIFDLTYGNESNES
jgi:SAM-dependent methyltransferase